VSQLKIGGLLFVEHTMQHTAGAASEMDPFGADAMIMPYLFAEWAGHRVSLEILKSRKSHSRTKSVTTATLDVSALPFSVDESGDGPNVSLVCRGDGLELWLFVLKRVM
jgi:hypothetical protein